ncbi:DivIVA domain-containing protein [Adhaeribacter sp. BT258]|uniref:DivIVA domain-containing protein n=1 Tax=Adhaeribacter terrigena TaxID=2793070 RepID=A0ABS1BY10_9BACT|nr:DivIVA domain-containing protein [Adhaeribacter terrigena]MBK0401954.1 DivIVA domain-containing protein [Adhaeribacter terrigena]
MKITPLEIRQKTFEKAFRGVDKDEVQAFLLTLSQQWEKMNDENKDLKMKLEVATREVQKMREVESSLYKTLKTAEDTSASIQEQANKEADLRIREAQFKADQLMNEARQKARSLIEDAYKQSEKAIAEMQQEVKTMEQEHERIESYVENLVRELKHLATDALEKVEKNQAKPKVSLSSIMSRAANIKVKEIEMDKDLLGELPVKTVAQNTPKVNTYKTPEALPVAAAVVASGGGGSEESIPESPKENPQPTKAPEHTPSTAPGTAPEREKPTQPQEPQPLEPVIQPEILPSTKPEPSINPATPGVTPPKPEVPQPETPVPNIPSPVVPNPEKDIPNIPKPEIERPVPEIQPLTPNTPEIQPPLTEPGKGPVFQKEKAMAETSFFDDL